MSNLGGYGNAKNAPWARSNVPNNSNNLVAQNNSLQQQLPNQSGLGNMSNTGIMQFQQQHQPQVFQNTMGMQQQNLGLGLQQITNPSVAMGSLGSQLAFQQVGTVTYPRALNPNAFQPQSMNAVSSVQGSGNTGTKQRVFTGTVTKVHSFGFVDEDVFFQTSACVKGSNPMVGDRVLVEASYNPTMPFKWNATRIQVIPISNQPTSSRNSSNQKNNIYSAVPPPNDSSNSFGKNARPKANIGGRGRERSRDRDRDDDDMERKRRREERLREREKEEKKSPLRRNRSRSPKPRRRSRIVPRYMVQIPKINLDLLNADVLEVRRRYNNLYVPSDFFCSYFRWVDAFPPDKAFSLSKPSSFYVIHKDVEPVAENDTVLEPVDADYLFSAKVMLLSLPGMEDMYHKCCAMAEAKDKRERDSEEHDFVHPTRLINFLVGLRGKNETMAIGGPWSPSLDGEQPDRDPTVLIKTAIRTCRALTGIDLSPCTQWYRFVELYYRRTESVHKGKVVPARVETVVLFLPDVWSCLPTRLEWEGLHLSYQRQLDKKLKADAEIADDVSTTDGEKEDESYVDKLEPTHHSQLDPKAMVISSLRHELKARNISSKGLKSQLVARLTKTLKTESEKDSNATKEKEQESSSGEPESEVEEKKPEVEEKKLDEKQKAQLEKRYVLPDQQHILVHPSRTAKSGKFDCTVMSLSLLLDYRPEDTKEHSFEVSLFAELFNEMLMRDFGFNIYKALSELPDKPKEKEEKKKKDDKEKKKDDKDKRDEKDKERKSEDKKNDKKDDERKRDRKSENVEESDEDDQYDDDGGKDKKKSDKDKKKKERVKMYTKDRNLLLSFIYFDQTHCGYIFEKDMEDLLFTLGLSISRAQVRKLVGKVISRDSLHYRKLTDKPKEDDFIVIDETDKESNVEELAVGNKNLLPVFEGDCCAPIKVKTLSVESTSQAVGNEDGLIKFRGALVDVAKLMAQLERVDKDRNEAEVRMVQLKAENTKLTEKYHKSNSTIKLLNADVKEYRDKLKSSEENLSRITTNSKLFQSTLIDIRDKIEPVLKSTAINSKDESLVKREKELKQDESKSRWEKSSKEPAKEMKPEKAEVKQEPMDAQQGDEVVEKKEMRVEKTEK